MAASTATASSVSGAHRAGPVSGSGQPASAVTLEPAMNSANPGMEEPVRPFRTPTAMGEKNENTSEKLKTTSVYATP